MTTSNAPNGITTAERDATLGRFILPDPTQSHLYWEDFDYYVAADWTVLDDGTSTQLLADEDGGILRLTMSSGENIGSGIVKKGESFLVETGKEAWMKARFNKVTFGTGYEVGLKIADNTDGMFFTNQIDSDTLGLIDKDLWTAGATATLGGTAPTNVTLANASGGADATISFPTIIGAIYSLIIDFDYITTEAKFQALDSSLTELGTVTTTGTSDSFFTFTFTAVETTTTLKWSNVTTTGTLSSGIRGVSLILDRDSFIVAKNSVRTTLDLGSLTDANTFVELGFYYDGTIVKIYFNDEFIGFVSDDNIPNDQTLSPSMEFFNGSSTASQAAQVADIDYFCAAKNR